MIDVWKCCILDALIKWFIDLKNVFQPRHVTSQSNAWKMSQRLNSRRRISLWQGDLEKNLVLAWGIFFMGWRGNFSWMPTYTISVVKKSKEIRFHLCFKVWGWRSGERMCPKAFYSVLQSGIACSTCCMLMGRHCRRRSNSCHWFPADKKPHKIGMCKSTKRYF